MLVTNAREMQQMCETLRMRGQTIGVVPTMGFLHEGHLRLIRAARERTNQVVTTVFVNPTQFGPAEDLERYPRNPQGDVDLAVSAGTDVVFAPAAGEMYPGGYETFVIPERLGTILEGKSRPGHFRGVATIVAKIFNITKPHVAVFGQKDAQQVQVIRRMVEDLNYDIHIVVVPTAREADGLAMSSRNSYLTPSERGEATVLFRSLQLARERIRSGKTETQSIIREMTDLIVSQSSGVVDYISIADHHSLRELEQIVRRTPVLVSLAVRFGRTRLIDNDVIMTE